MPRAAQSFRPERAVAPPAALHVAAGPDAALALDLAIAARQGDGLLFIDATGSRLSRLAGIAQAFVPDLEVLLLPAWDSLPYDHTPPSRAVMGRRAQSLACLAEPCDRPRPGPDQCPRRVAARAAARALAHGDAVPRGR